MNGREAGAGVVAVLQAGTPVLVKDNFSGGWTEIEEIVQDGSHGPAHGYIKNKYLKVPNE